ncbi:MAG: hypothetical protein P8166_02010 [Candidatus Thiodiazotropha sp.]|jgi:hypothetical protein
MSLVSVETIKTPKMAVAPPKWLMVIVASMFLLIFVALFFIPIDSTPLKIAIIGVCGVVLLAIANRARGGNYLVTMQANRDGVYFQTDRDQSYFFIPWRCIGAIEKAAFPLNSRGLRFEITGEYKNIVRDTDLVGNVMSMEEKIFIYTIPQLNDRDKLIEKIIHFRDPVFKNPKR